MAYINPLEVSHAELLRIAGLAYNGKSFRVSLAYDPSNTLTTESTVSAYDALEISVSGYSRVTGTLGTGGYNPVTERYEVGSGSGYATYVPVQFGPFSADATYDTIYYVIAGSAYIYGRRKEIPAIAVTSGERVRPYPFEIVVDNAF